MRDPEQVADQGIRGRAAAGAAEAARPRLLHDVPDHEEVFAKAQVADDVQLVAEALPDGRGSSARRPISLLRSLQREELQQSFGDDSFDFSIRGRPPVGRVGRRIVSHTKVREVEMAKAEVDLALVGDAEGVGDGLGIGGELAHHGASGLEVALRAAAADGMPFLPSG